MPPTGLGTMVPAIRPSAITALDSIAPTTITYSSHWCAFCALSLRASCSAPCSRCDAVAAVRRNSGSLFIGQRCVHGRAAPLAHESERPKQVQLQTGRFSHTRTARTSDHHPRMRACMCACDVCVVWGLRRLSPCRVPSTAPKCPVLCSTCTHTAWCTATLKYVPPALLRSSLPCRGLHTCAALQGCG